MNEKRDFKKEIKDWWSKNKRPIKVGATCLFIGAFCGFVKGVNSTIINIDLVRDPGDRNDGSNFEYNESNVDDPELLELIRMGHDGNS